jgi:hypothetical protein
MNWYWRVRIHDKDGNYWHAQITTSRNLREIDAIQEFYAILTGCKMLIEGMSEQPDENLGCIQDAFNGLWKPALKTAQGEK